jgi:hypothetical protein
MLRVMASAADGAEPREVHLRSYEVGDAVPALAGRADALVAAAARSEPMLFVPGHGRRGSLGDHDGTGARVDRVRPARPMKQPAWRCPSSAVLVSWVVANGEDG